MGWLNTIIDVASLGAEIAQVDQLNDMRKRNASASLLQSIVQELRNQIFNYRQSAETILEMEERSPKVAAGGLRVLGERLRGSGITAELFLEISDKEYFATTAKFIRENANRLLSQLSSEEVQEVEEVVNSAYRLPMYNYYIDNQLDYLVYKSTKNNLGSPDFFGGSQNKFGCTMTLVTLVIVMLFTSIFSNSPGTGFFLGAVVSIGVSFWYGRKFRAARNAKETLESLDKKLDVSLLERLDNEVNGDLRKAIKLRNEASTRVKNFFEESLQLPL